MFKDYAEQIAYIVENYPEITDQRVDEHHWDLQCSHCGTVRGFQLIEKSQTRVRDSMYGQSYSVDTSVPYTLLFRCPVCKAYKQWIVFSFSAKGVGASAPNTRIFRVASIPNEGIEDIEELPTEPASLRIAYKQAIRAMDANAHIAAAAMFRRALQIITRDVLKAKPSTLANELRSVVGTKYDGATITNDFSTVGYIVKEAGNQGAHPDKDADLLDFTAQDSKDLQDIFMELVSDLFVVPKVQRLARAEFLGRRKISPTS